MTIKNQENRTFNITSIETRSVGEDGGHVLSGYASVFNSKTTIHEGLEEVISPGAFSNAISNNSDVRCLFNHSWDSVLGRTRSGTLKLEEDKKGLKFEVELPDTTLANDLIKSIERGDIDQCSFGFWPTKEVWDYDSNPVLRTIESVELYDVSIVTLPAYADTEVSLVRSNNMLEKSNIEKRKKILNILEGAIKNG
ncbi:HK97 family phage prohead protease [Vagococcus carniphilus]|uniref:HK97 family phage prohead protease n=1 Tax=Vagococcus carniphilus TaxID=218144 RepID=UPI00288CF739|nr:HK97 family phage prohead protease [Vagococcus carniphilus]MDT2850172.1 HK97 family phage prohead protease [Vagococcus carniphilus]